MIKTIYKINNDIFNINNKSNQISNYINMYHGNQNNKDDFYKYDAGSIDINSNSYMTSIEKKFREEISKYPKTG
jgi:hypothetical protein